MVQVGLIGAGRVGRTLTALLPREEFQLGPVVGRTLTSARRSVREMGTGSATADLDALSGCKLILIAVPDAVLPHFVGQIVAARVNLARTTVLQTSRLHNSTDLARLRRLGAAVGSLQPMFVLRRAVPSLSGLCWAIEGDPAATRMARKMIRSWDGEFQLVQAEQKLHVSIACSIAADFLPGLLELAVQQFSSAGLLKKRSLRAISHVLDTAFHEYSRSGRRARVGPLLRNEPGTVQSYIERLGEIDPPAAESYRRTALQTLEILRRMNDEFSYLERSPAPRRRAMRAAAGGRSE